MPQRLTTPSSGAYLKKCPEAASFGGHRRARFAQTNASTGTCHSYTQHGRLTGTEGAHGNGSFYEGDV
ncbi:hypothetical protein HJFPF1_01196 [Paramyrothecium foliicola]|nr:hypothetical protein HJFPF1_01196 [Paramyrothecium foliicola]